MNSNNYSFRKVKKDPADISAVVGIYNSNKVFLIHHLGKEQSLQTEKGSVIYWKSDNWKKDADTIFFLHGLTADHTMFDRQTPYFEKEYNVIVWDAPGHAQSRPFKDFDYADVAEYINSILDECDVKRVFLAGQSLGGMHAQAFIKRYPDRAKGLISIDSTPYGFDYYSKFDIWILKQVEWMFNLYPLRAMKKAMSKQVSVTQEAYDNMMESLLPYGKKEICHLVGMSYAGFLEDNCNLEIPCPVLLILGEKDKTGKVMHYNKAWAEKTGYPLKIVKDAAHNVNVDRPDEVNAYIREFMEGVNASQLSI